jgi:predicted SAM-dependent methyltransferase
MKQFLKSVPLFGRMLPKVYRLVKVFRGKRRLVRSTKVSPLKIVIGAAGVFDKGWIGTDVDCLNLLERKHWDSYFQKNSIDAILAEHVWEHLTIEDGLTAAENCFAYLKPGGYLRAAVPDGFHPSKQYIDWVRVGGSGPGSDDHKVLFNHQTFRQLFEKAGFRVTLLEYFDERAEFHYSDWDPQAGNIRRSRRFDKRNTGGALAYTSVILDAYK